MLIRSIGFIMFMFAGCGVEDPAYTGGTIWYSPDDNLPMAAPECVEVEDPNPWEAQTCVENSSGECCYWLENIIMSSTLENIIRTESVVECRYDWCYDKYECEWHHVLSQCDGE